MTTFRLRLFSFSMFFVFALCGGIACSARVGNTTQAQPTPGGLPTTNAAQTEAQQTGDPKSAQRTFRGQLGDRSIEMKLRRDGEKISGTYSYDGIGQDLSLDGRIDAQNKVTLTEMDANKKQTGTFKLELTEAAGAEPLAQLSGTWTRPDGSKEANVSLSEQFSELSGPLKFASKTIKETRFGIAATYPQLTGVQSPAVAGFNRRVSEMVTKMVTDFKEVEPTPGKSYYETNYNVLLATNDFISIEIAENSYAGGAYPNTAQYTVNYDLRGNGRELQLEDFFQSQPAVQRAIAEYAAKVLNEQMKQERQREGQATGDDDFSFSADQLESWTGWGFTRKGVVVFLDLPHAVASLSMVFVPYDELKNFIKPNGMVATVSGSSR